MQSNTSGTALDKNTAAPAVATPLLFEPPAAMTGNVSQIWIAACGGKDGYSAVWGGAYVWASVDQTNYSRMGTLAAPARMGTLSVAVDAAASAIAVDLAESHGALTAGTFDAADTDATACWLDGEKLGYASAAVSGSYAYTLSSLTRGEGGTSAAAHAAGAMFCRLDSAIGKIDLTSAVIGKTLYVKLQSFNIWGGGAEDISACTVYTLVPSGIGSLDSVLEALSIGSGIDLGYVYDSSSHTTELGLATASSVTTINLGEV